MVLNITQSDDAGDVLEVSTFIPAFPPSDGGTFSAGAAGPAALADNCDDTFDGVVDIVLESVSSVSQEIS